MVLILVLFSEKGERGRGEKERAHRRDTELWPVSHHPISRLVERRGKEEGEGVLPQTPR